MAAGLGAAACALGVYAAWHYAQLHLTLSHYDARAHLVVARRVIDSLTPGWAQVGAVWLPLPHLLNLLPVQLDALYRTGWSAVAISVASFALLVGASARLILQAAGSRAAACAGAVVIIASPDLVYLQATPMTEPLLLGLMVLMLTLMHGWLLQPRPGPAPASLGATMAAACLTRYEAWPVAVAALLLAAMALWRRRLPTRVVLVRVGTLALYPAAACALFLLQSRATMGVWFVTGGFYVPDNPDMGRPFKTVGSIWWATHQMQGYGVLLAAVAGAAAIVLAGLASRVRAATWVVLALGASAALPWYAFVNGHPFRFRYMVPLVPALAVWGGIGVGLMPRRLRGLAAFGLVCLAALGARPFNPRAPMVVEAQLDRPRSLERQAITQMLAGRRPGEKILASLGSLSHYVQELSAIGVAIRDVVHEGNGDLWAAAIARPDAHVTWVLIEEQSEGGDTLAARREHDPSFLAGFVRVAEGGGVALYRCRQSRVP